MSDRDLSLNLLDDLLVCAKKAGADAADALLVESAGQSAAFRLGKLEQVERAEGRDLGLRVFVGRQQAIVSTGELGADSLDRLVEQALAIARAVPEDRFAGLAEPKRIARDPPALELDDGEEPSGERLAEMAAAAEEGARAHPKITNSEGAEASWSRTRTTLAATNGFIGASARSSHSISVSVIAEANGAMERDYDFATRVRARDLPDPAEIGRSAAERTARRLGARKVRTQTVPIVLDPRVAGSIVRHLAVAISGPAVARGTTFLKDRLGDEVFAREVCIIDDPLRPLGLRSRAFDAEGIAGRRMAVVKHGVLNTWLLDCTSARQLDLASTGHAARSVSSAPSPVPSNAYIEASGISPTELMQDIEQGFYIVEMLGMGISYVTGDYSRGAAGFWIEDGEITYPVSEVTVAGSLPEMFRRLRAADDLEFRYGIDAPTLRIDGMTVAGQ
jgi:PmbA protein